MNLSLRVIGQKIYLVRNQQVMLDTDLASLYEIETFNLNKSVKRNSDHFPDDFMFQLTREEWITLTFRNGMSKNTGRGGRRTIPYAFTQEGVAMLSSVLRSETAREINIAIQRSFAEFRKNTNSNARLAEKIDHLETNLNLKIATLEDGLRNVIATVKALPKQGMEVLPTPFSLPISYREESVRQAFSADPPNKRGNLQVEIILDAVSRYYHVSLQKLKSSVRTASIAHPRQICMFLIRKYTEISLQKIGFYFGGRDHSTVIHACDRIESLLLKDEEVRKEVATIESWLAEKGTFKTV